MQISFSEWMNKQTVIHAFNGILLSNEKEQTIDIHNYWAGCQKHYTKAKKASLKELHAVWFHLHNVLKMTKL